MKKFWLWLAKLASRHLGTPSIPIKDILAETKKGLNDKERTEFERGYNNFSGADVKVLFEYKDGSAEIIAEIQAISWSVDLTKKCLTEGSSVEGRLIVLLFDRDPMSKRQERIKNIKLVAANEYGVCVTARLCNIKFLTHNYRISIDDIISESKWDYEADYLEPWTSITLDNWVKYKNEVGLSKQ